MLLIRQPSPHRGNVGDQALVDTIRSCLTSAGIEFDCPSVRQAESLVDITQYECLLYFGNDTFAYYGISKGLIELFIAAKKPIYLINISYGESTKNNYLEKISKYNNLFIWARDKYSMEIISQKADPVNKVELCADLAHLLPDRFDFSKNLSDNQQKLLNWLSSSFKPVVVVNIHSDFDENNKIVHGQFTDLCTKYSHQFRFLFLPHDSRVRRGELAINKEYSEKFRDNSFLSSVLDPEFEISILRRCYCVITCRMHLGILALRAGIPPLIVGYNGIKARGLLNHWLLEAELYVNPSTPNVLIDNFSKLLVDYSSVRTKISIQYPNVAQYALRPLLSIAQSLNTNSSSRLFSCLIEQQNEILHPDNSSLSSSDHKDPWSYDKDILLKNIRQNAKKDYKSMSKQQLHSSLTMDYHRIEKGLSMPNTKPNFGIASGVLNRMYEMFEIYVDKFQKKDQILFISYDCLSMYYQWHNQRGIQAKCLKLVPFLDKYKEYSSDNASRELKGGFICLTRDETIAKSQSLETFFLSRRSVREYDHGQLDTSKIKLALHQAIIGTPTVCNRDINRVHLVTDQSMKGTLLSLQNGNKGFGDLAPALLVITSNLQNFQQVRERRTPYIGGGMFAMSLAYALHKIGYATCCLNWDVEPDKDIKARSILGLYNETIIMYMLVGNYKENYKVAFSQKPSVNDILTIHGNSNFE